MFKPIKQVITGTEKSNGKIVALCDDDWKISTAEAILNIEDGSVKYYATVLTEIVVRTTSTGEKYLATVADDTESNNLSKLPDCK